MASLLCLMSTFDIFKLFIHLLLLLQFYYRTSKSKALYYRISPDDPGGPFYVRDKSINDTFIFEFEKFETNSKYQVILSYPGYLPIECESNITQENVYDHKGSGTYKSDTNNNENKNIYNMNYLKTESRRRLLDTNIETFMTGNRAIEQTIIKIIIKCKPLDKKAFDEMIINNKALKSHRKSGKVDITKYIVQFGIKVESLWFGIIPNSLIGLAIAALVVGLIIVLWITPFILRNIKPHDE